MVALQWCQYHCNAQSLALAIYAAGTSRTQYGMAQSQRSHLHGQLVVFNCSPLGGRWFMVRINMNVWCSVATLYFCIVVLTLALVLEYVA